MAFSDKTPKHAFLEKNSVLCKALVFSENPATYLETGTDMYITLCSESKHLDLQCTIYFNHLCV